MTDLLRFATAGSVDDGKSTLVGRLLHDTGSLPAARIEQVRAISAKRGLDLEFSFLLDSLQVERDLGVTVDAPVTVLRVYCTWPGVSASTNSRVGVPK